MADTDAYQLWLASPYGQVHQQAEETKRRKQLDCDTLPPIWQNLTSYLDLDDIYDDGGKMRKHSHLRAIAAYHLRRRWNHKHDLSVEALQYKDRPANLLPKFGRDVEQSAFVVMLEQALKHYAKGKQETVLETLILLREGKLQGLNTKAYIANTLKISPDSAKERLANTNLISIYPPKSHENDIIKIEQALQQYTRQCAWCENPSPRQSQALCYDCEERFYFRDDFPPNLTPEKLQTIVNKSHAEHRRYINQLAKELAA